MESVNLYMHVNERSKSAYRAKKDGKLSNCRSCKVLSRNLSLKRKEDREESRWELRKPRLEQHKLKESQLSVLLSITLPQSNTYVERRCEI